jgi:predicted site-specific integrase-resolvase
MHQGKLTFHKIGSMNFISVITSFSARIYGQRRSKRKTEMILKELEAKE